MGIFSLDLSKPIVLTFTLRICVERILEALSIYHQITIFNPANICRIFIRLCKFFQSPAFSKFFYLSFKTLLRPFNTFKCRFCLGALYKCTAVLIWLYRVIIFSGNFHNLLLVRTYKRPEYRRVWRPHQ